MTQPIGGGHIKCIQPALLKHPNGRLQLLCRTRNNSIGSAWSLDGGETWSEMTLLDVPNNNSGIDAVTLHDGKTQALVYNDFSIAPGLRKGLRNPLDIAISKDGMHWQHWITLEDSPINQYSYPSMIEGSDGYLHIVYTW